MARFIGFWCGLFWVVLSISTLGCDGKSPLNAKIFKERAAETPAPSDERIEKSFFVDPTGKPKTFLCGQAPEMSRGLWASAVTLLRHETPHCNVEFEVTHDFLIGKMINPSYPTDRTRWDELIRIPIESHFYYERERDEYGRETNRWIENQRSDWSARPEMKLRLAGAEISELFYGLPVRVSAVRDIEWDRVNNFLGFTLSVSFWDTLFQADYRVNFLKFEHDPNFKKNLYHQENSKFINVLHVMGRQLDGMFPELYAARWDFSKPVKMYVSNVPDQLQNVIVDAVEEWNSTLMRIGVIGQGEKAFIPIFKNLKHPFDLRYPSFNWISDVGLAMNAPLGVGMAHADVRNGKILWGSVTLWGGALESFINSYAPIGFGSATAFGDEFPLSRLAPEIPKRMEMPEMFSQFLKTSEETLIAKMNAQLSRGQIAQNPAESENGIDANAKAILSQIITESKSKLTEGMNSVENHFKHNSIEDSLQSEFVKMQHQRKLAKSPVEQIAAKFKSGELAKLGMASAGIFEEGLTIENLAPSFHSSQAQTLRTYPEMLRSVVKELVLHEVGHVLGLGHQFKENIVPKKGTVPNDIWKELSDLATPEAHFQNKTSVMGYRSGDVELMSEYEKMVPGPHDELVLRYIYKGEYPVYDAQADKFVEPYPKVPVSGRIPAKASYFPACNDWEASLGADPFCNRFDKGSRAVDIVKSYFDSMSENLVSSLYSMVGGKTNPAAAEARLWYSSISQLSRVRLFYDEMRRRLRLDPKLAPLWDKLRGDPEGLFEFSTACAAEDSATIKNGTLKQIFADEQIKDLCRANLQALTGFRFFLNLSPADYTKMDFSQRFIPSGFLAGDAASDYGNVFGSWYQLTNLPLKLISLYSLTTAVPFSMTEDGLGANPFYSHEEDKYLYRTMYPREYTRLIADSIKSNLRFQITGRDSNTTIGKTVLAAGWMVPNDRSNDPAVLPGSYTRTLNSQSEFQIGLVAIVVEALQSEGLRPDHYNKFSAKVYDYMADKQTTARDVFLLPKGEFIVRVNGMFLYPVTKLRFYDNTHAYALAYKVGYDFEVGDPLLEDSIKFSLTELHDQIQATCIDGFSADGKSNGLQSWFESGNQDFKGFYLPPDMYLEDGKEKLTSFYDSIDAEFLKYDIASNKKIPSGMPSRMQDVCSESTRGVGQILAAGALVNGYWLPITYPYLVK